MHKDSVGFWCAIGLHRKGSSPAPSPQPAWHQRSHSSTAMESWPRAPQSQRKRCSEPSQLKLPCHRCHQLDPSANLLGPQRKAPHRCKGGRPIWCQSGCSCHEFFPGCAPRQSKQQFLGLSNPCAPWKYLVLPMRLTGGNDCAPAFQRIPWQRIWVLALLGRHRSNPPNGLPGVYDLAVSSCIENGHLRLVLASGMRWDTQSSICRTCCHGILWLPPLQVEWISCHRHHQFDRSKISLLALHWLWWQLYLQMWWDRSRRSGTQTRASLGQANHELCPDWYCLAIRSLANDVVLLPHSHQLLCHSPHARCQSNAMPTFQRGQRSWQRHHLEDHQQAKMPWSLSSTWKWTRTNVRYPVPSTACGTFPYWTDVVTGSHEESPSHAMLARFPDRRRGSHRSALSPQWPKRSAENPLCATPWCEQDSEQDSERRDGTWRFQLAASRGISVADFMNSTHCIYCIHDQINPVAVP